MLPARPTQEGQTDQLAQVTLAHLIMVAIVGEMNEEKDEVYRRGVAFLAAGSGRWQLAVSHQDGAGRVDLLASHQIEI